jgi:hypothetical protein
MVTDAVVTMLASACLSLRSIRLSNTQVTQSLAKV